MKTKGVCNDVGRVMTGSSLRPKFDREIVQQELELIKNDLHCNAARIQGLDIHRLQTASEFALNLSLDVWFSAEMWDKPEEETIEYTIKAAKEAESLRKQSSDALLLFSVGPE